MLNGEGEEEERGGGREGKLNRMREVGGMSERVGGTRKGSGQHDGVCVDRMREGVGRMKGREGGMGGKHGLDEGGG